MEHLDYSLLFRWFVGMNHFVQLANDRNRIRKGRNDATHVPIRFQFDQSPQPDHINLLAKNPSRVVYTNVKEWASWPDTRKQFLGVAGWMLNALHDELKRLSPLEGPPMPEFGYADESDITPATQA